MRNIILLVLAVIAAACRPAGQDLKTEIVEFTDSTAHSRLTFKAELPLPGTATAIRTRLVEVVDRQLSHIGSYEEDRLFPPFDGNAEDTRALTEYYRGKSLEALGRLSDEDYAERVVSIGENDGITEAEKADILAGMPGWEYEFSLEKIRENPRYVVFLSRDYVYLGGAHGGIVGCGALTFGKEDGQLVERFLDPDCLDDIQPLLRKGLVSYFSDQDTDITPESLDNYLMLENGLVPFPAWTPFPEEDGLAFTYQQYEIAAYAAGMPNFTIPYDDILPFLTPEAKELLAISQ